MLKLDDDDIMNMPGWSVLCRVCATFKRSFEKPHKKKIGFEQKIRMGHIGLRCNCSLSHFERVRERKQQ